MSHERNDRTSMQQLREYTQQAGIKQMRMENVYLFRF
jgi:hypothetical protein